MRVVAEGEGYAACHMVMDECLLRYLMLNENINAVVDIYVYLDPVSPVITLKPCAYRVNLASIVHFISLIINGNYPSIFNVS